ncbi:hypothetical protein EVAR_101389_1 [Eumeta japonica]|uniref:Uncharacterized protein n=1 Tax=Eumeta variegata TaxID=151549 RepID=A0A4C1T3E5_EUMVA|nr:hypothetical protein EVAR_101389_1 [Eumeta japonica]
MSSHFGKIKKIADINTKLSPSSSGNKLNIKLTRDNSRSSNWKISSYPSNEIIVDTIDLCTSDEEDVDEDNQNKLCSSNLSSVANKSSLGPSSNITPPSDNKNNKFNKNALKTLHNATVTDIEKQLNLTVDSSFLVDSRIKIYTPVSKITTVPHV